MNYYNDIDDFCCRWLRNLIDAGLLPKGDVDNRSIKEVQPDDLNGYTQCHFFAGIGGWSCALRIAEWPEDRPIWTASLPCQPFSVAGAHGGTDDPRHLWPDFFRLLRAARPPVVMGEQVSGKAGYDWFDGVATDLEGEGYTTRAVDIPACAVGSEQVRSRLYWVARTWSERLERYMQERESVCDQQSAPSTQRSNRSIFTRVQDWADPSAVPIFDGVSRPVDIVHAFGNAIVPPLAAEVIRTYMETKERV